jgi:tyrosine-protein kinase Etk/Wzc
MKVRRRRGSSDDPGPTPVYSEFLRDLTSSPEIIHAYNTLLSSLHLLNPTRQLKTLLVTSSRPEEGKTTVTINLALAMTIRTVIVDADLRKPRLHAIFGLDNARGFADLISWRSSVLSFSRLGHVVEVQPTVSDVTWSLGVVTSGTGEPNSFTGLTPSKLKETIDSLTLDFDVALLDSPPVLAANDALVLAPLVDGIIFVLDTGNVTEGDVRSAKGRLTEAGGHILGVAMNRFDARVHGPGFHPYESYCHSGPNTST